jgi:hypothetical protein
MHVDGTCDDAMDWHGREGRIHRDEFDGCIDACIVALGAAACLS